jgi:hypothetical protein
MMTKGIEGMHEIDLTDPAKRLLVRLLLDSYEQRVLAIVAAVPGWVAEEILSTSEHVGEHSAAVM